MSAVTTAPTGRPLAAYLRLLTGVFFSTLLVACSAGDAKDDGEKPATHLPNEIVGMLPSHGPVGSTVEIYVDHYDGLPEVYFGDITAEARLLSARVLEAVVPAGFSLATVYLAVDGIAAPVGRFTATYEDRSPWSVLDAGGGHVCGIKEDHSLWCWGDNTSAQLGVRTAVDKSYFPLTVTGSWNAVSVPGYLLVGNTCARTTDGEVSCWGDNLLGPFALSYGALLETPTKLPGNWDEVQLGGGLTCGTRDGALYCWSLFEQALHEPVLVDGGPWSAYSVGYVHACAIDQGGLLSCWGFNDQGQLGNGKTSAVLTATPQSVAGDGTWRQVSTGGYAASDPIGSTCAISSDDELFCWGGNPKGQLGIAAAGPVTAPHIVDSGSWSSVDVSTDGACGLKTDGTLWCWGRGHHEMHRMGDLSDWVSVASAHAPADDTPFNLSVIGDDALFACGLREDKSAWCVALDRKSGESAAFELKELAVSGRIALSPPVFEE